MARADRRDRGVFRYRDKAGRELWGVRLMHQGKDVRFRLGIENKTTAATWYQKAKLEQFEGRFFPERYRARTTPKLLSGTVKDPLLKEYAKPWLAYKDTQGLKHTTAASYDTNLRVHILPVLGGHPLSSISRSTVKHLAASLAKQGASRSKIRSVIATLSSLFSEAIEDGKAVINPCLRPGKFLKTEPTEEIEILTPAEEHLLLDAATRTIPRWYPFLLFLLRTGVRIGEGLAVKVTDLDWHGRYVKIQRTFSRGQVTSTKGRRNRRVDLSPQMIAALKAHTASQVATALKAGRSQSPWLFPNEIGELKHYRNFMGRTWKTVLKQAKLRAITPHILRHTWVSRLIAKGAHLPYISRQAGHSSIKVTVDRYGHLLPQEGRFIDTLDEDAAERQGEAKNRAK